MRPALFWQTGELMLSAGTGWLTVRALEGELLLRLQGSDTLAAFAKMVCAVIDSAESASGELAGRQLALYMEDGATEMLRLVIDGTTHLMEAADGDDLASTIYDILTPGSSARVAGICTPASGGLLFRPHGNAAEEGPLAFGRDAARRLASELMLAAGGATGLRRELVTPTGGGTLLLERSQKDYWFTLSYTLDGETVFARTFSPGKLALHALALHEQLEDR